MWYVLYCMWPGMRWRRNGIAEIQQNDVWLMLSWVWVVDGASGNVEGLLFLAINASREFMITLEDVVEQ